MFSSMICGTMPRSAPRRKSEPRWPVNAQQQACGTTSRSCITFMMSMICGMTTQMLHLLHLPAIVGNAARDARKPAKPGARPLRPAIVRNTARGADLPAKPADCKPLPLLTTNSATKKKERQRPQDPSLPKHVEKQIQFFQSCPQADEEYVSTVKPSVARHTTTENAVNVVQKPPRLTRNLRERDCQKGAREVMSGNPASSTSATSPVE